MNTIELFVLLIKNTLNRSIDEKLSVKKVNWDELYGLAVEQNVISILMEA